MFKKEVTYVDFNGTERTETLYFHMSVPEASRLEAKLGGKTIEEYAKSLEADQDIEKSLAFVELMILSSYGKKSENGKAFLKTKDIVEEFEYSQAYAELFEEIILSPATAQQFAQGIGTKPTTVKAPRPTVLPTGDR